MKGEQNLEYSPACTKKPSEIVPEKGGFLVNVLNIENVTMPRSVVIKLDFCGINLSSSQVIPLESSSETNISWEYLYEIPDISENLIKDLTSNPFLIWFEDTSVSVTDLNLREKGIEKKEKSAKTKKGGSKKESVSVKTSKKGNSRGSRSKSPTRKQSTESDGVKSTAPLKLLGMAAFDIIPLLLGETCVREVLLIHPTVEERGSKAVSWTNLPKLLVQVTGLNGITDRIQEVTTNFLHFTLETLHNIPQHFHDGVQVATVYPLNKDFEVVKFSNGALVLDNLTWGSKWKKWCSLSDIQGKGSLSTYRICENFRELVNTMEHKLSKPNLESVPRIQWHQLHRTNMTAESQTVLKEKLVQYRCWPVELISSSSTPQGKEPSDLSTKSGKKSPKESPEKEENKNLYNSPEKKSGHFITFLDLSKLLYPGGGAKTIFKRYK